MCALCDLFGITSDYLAILGLTNLQLKVDEIADEIAGFIITDKEIERTLESLPRKVL